MCKLLENPSRVLDIGCGPGWAIDYLEGVEYFGLDISPNACAAVEKKGGKGESDPDKIENNAFDGVICGEVIEHLEDDEEMIRYSNKKLKPNGVIVVSVPMHNVMEDPTHVRDYTEGEILSLINKFFIVECHENMWPWIIIKGRKRKAI